MEEEEDTRTHAHTRTHTHTHTHTHTQTLLVIVVFSGVNMRILVGQLHVRNHKVILLVSRSGVVTPKVSFNDLCG